MSVKITYFVHGTTTDNEQDLATGWLPGELSALGIQQAKDLGGQVADKQFDVVFCSDLKRAVDSANFGFGDKYKIIPDPRLRECNYGDNNGKPDEFKSDMTAFIDQAVPQRRVLQGCRKTHGRFSLLPQAKLRGQAYCDCRPPSTPTRT